MAKTCKAEGCNYPVFSHLYCKGHQWVRQDKKASHKPKNTIKRSKIKKISDKQKELNKEYNKLKIKLKKLPENKMCVVSKELWNEDVETEDCHHIYGRGYFFLKTDTWMFVSRKAHEWIHDNHAEAVKRGWLATQEMKRKYRLKEKQNGED